MSLGQLYPSQGCAIRKGNNVLPSFQEHDVLYRPFWRTKPVKHHLSRTPHDILSHFLFGWVGRSTKIQAFHPPSQRKPSTSSPPRSTTFSPAATPTPEPGLVRAASAPGLNLASIAQRCGFLTRRKLKHLERRDCFLGVDRFAGIDLNLNWIGFDWIDLIYCKLTWFDWIKLIWCDSIELNWFDLIWFELLVWLIDWLVEVVNYLIIFD